VNLRVDATRHASVAVKGGIEAASWRQNAGGFTVPEEVAARKQVGLGFALDDSALQRGAAKQISQSQ
jgi:hypothetical protein